MNKLCVFCMLQDGCKDTHFISISGTFVARPRNGGCTDAHRNMFIGGQGAVRSLFLRSFSHRSPIVLPPTKEN
jgi:hypothetical protein